MMMTKATTIGLTAVALVFAVAPPVPAVADDLVVTGCLGDQGYASQCPASPSGRPDVNWRNYSPAPNGGTEHFLMAGGAWGSPFKLVCDIAEDTVATVDGRAKCVGRSGVPYEPVFQRPEGNAWVFCNPYDTSGYNSCFQPPPLSKRE
jgi:hypothetical protein